MALIDRIHEANRFDPAGLVPFVIGDHQVGHADPDFAQALGERSKAFEITDGRLYLAPNLGPEADASRTVAPVLVDLRDDGLITGWRNELYPVFTEPFSPPLLLIERAAATLFGIQTICVNLNGYVEEGGQLSIWVQRRAMTKPISPGKLDVFVSGGLPAGGDPYEDLVRECAEEAGISEDLARQSTYASTIEYRARRDDGVHHGHYLNYDLRVPATFNPDNQDGEVAGFDLIDAEALLDILTTTDEVAFDSALVMIDFLIRRGVLSDRHPEYAAVCKALYP